MRRRGRAYRRRGKQPTSDQVSFSADRDPAGLFNASLEGNTRRAIDFRDGEKINDKALKALVRAAVALNKSKAKS